MGKAGFNIVGAYKTFFISFFKKCVCADLEKGLGDYIKVFKEG